jgi:hypothetical protein
VDEMEMKMHQEQALADAQHTRLPQVNAVDVQLDVLAVTVGSIVEL